MKNVLLFLFTICCSMVASSQQANNYTHKLDSICYGDDAIDLFTYDDQWNCINIRTIFAQAPDELYSEKIFSYNEENHLIKTEYSCNFGLEKYTHEYTYNEDGLVIEDITINEYVPDLIDTFKYMYEYDEDHHKTQSKYLWLQSNGTWDELFRVLFEYEDNLLIKAEKFNDENSTPDVITNYTYNSLGLCLEIVKSQRYNGEIEKTLYTYDEFGNRTSITVFTKEDPWEDEWIESSRSEFVYDENGNCTTRSYDNNTSYNFTYDMTVSVNETTGFMEWLGYYIDFGFVPQNIASYYYYTDFDGTISGPITFHYSGCNGVAETTDGPMRIWPNPVSETLYLDKEGFIEVYNMEGRLVLSSQASESINVSELPKGCYLLKTTQSGHGGATKFIKK